MACPSDTHPFSFLLYIWRQNWMAILFFFSSFVSNRSDKLNVKTFEHNDLWHLLMSDISTRRSRCFIKLIGGIFHSLAIQNHRQSFLRKKVKFYFLSSHIKKRTQFLSNQKHVLSLFLHWNASANSGIWISAAFNAVLSS
jgi:hypothetical protein